VIEARITFLFEERSSKAALVRQYVYGCRFCARV